MTFKLIALGALACSAVLAAPLPAAHAQGADGRYQSVTERDRPEYDPAGVRAGAFMLFPSATAGFGHDSDVFATDLLSEDSGFFLYGLNLEGESLWSRHSASFDIGLDGSAYTDLEDESFTDLYAFGEVGLEAARDLFFEFDLGVERLNEPRTANNTTAANALLLTEERIQFDRFTLGAAATRIFNRLRIIADADFTDLDYDDAVLVGGNISDQDVRDRDVTRFGLRGDYALSPDSSLFLAGAVNSREYDQTSPDPTLARSSDGYEIVAGMRMGLTNLIQGEFFLGYQSQDYDGSALSDIDGLDYGADLDWFVSPLTTLTFEASSSIEESVVAGASGFIAQRAAIGFEREIRRNVIAEARVFVESDDFEGIAREDDRYGFESRLDILVNRSVSVFGDIQYADQSSNSVGNSFERTVVRIGITLRR
ncbi:MAG: outer membrane beta-barrel protein [Oceanicaulis sp.]